MRIQKVKHLMETGVLWNGKAQCDCVMHCKPAANASVMNLVKIDLRRNEKLCVTNISMHMFADPFLYLHREIPMREFP